MTQHLVPGSENSLHILRGHRHAGQAEQQVPGVQQHLHAQRSLSKVCGAALSCRTPFCDQRIALFCTSGRLTTQQHLHAQRSLSTVYNSSPLLQGIF